MPKKPLPLTILFVSLALMLAVSFLSLRLSSVLLMLAAGALSLLAYGLRQGKGGTEK